MRVSSASLKAENAVGTLSTLQPVGKPERMQMGNRFTHREGSLVHIHRTPEQNSHGLSASSIFNRAAS